MPTIVIAKDAGACYGVERALTLVRSAMDEFGDTVCTLGPLIHNPLVVRELEDYGVKSVSSPQNARGKALVLRTHGVSPQEEAQAHAICSVVIDASCPFVKRVHTTVERFEREGLQVVIIGEDGHPEVEGTKGHVKNPLVIGSLEEAQNAELEDRIGVVVQTTLSSELLDSIVEMLLKRVSELHLENTICKATYAHQLGAVECAKSADVMLVVGGKNSANTTHLAQLCQELCLRTYHIESTDEIDSTWFIDAQTIGITAGASTPEEQIVSVKKYIETLVES